jgi:Rod binding domain-containing protein
MMMDTVTNSTASLVQTMKNMGESTKTDKAMSALKAAATSKDMKKAEQAAEEFEAVFIGEMLKPMFNMIEVDENFGGGKGEEIFRDLMVQEYGKMIARQGGIGIASQIKAELLRAQETHTNPDHITGDYS